MKAYVPAVMVSAVLAWHSLGAQGPSQMAWAQDTVSSVDGSPAEPGTAAPAFSEKDIFDRGTVSLKDLAGKVVLLNFWATWCPPCKEEIPALKALQEAHEGKLVVVGVSVFCSNTATELFYAEYRINYPMIYGSFELMGKYGKVNAIPTTFVIDQHGVIAARVVGSRTQSEYEAMLKPLLH